MPDPQLPFWRRKAMSEMTRAEWESLCDGCGRCCLNKLIDEDTNATVYTDVSCKLLDCQSCKCSDYAHRQAKVKDCVRLTPRNVRRLKWLPPTCAYRLVAEGKDLAWWHPLVSGDPNTVHTAGISVRGRVAASEKDVPDEKLEEYIVAWPGSGRRGQSVSRGDRAATLPKLEGADKLAGELAEWRAKAGREAEMSAWRRRHSISSAILKEFIKQTAVARP